MRLEPEEDKLVKLRAEVLATLVCPRCAGGLQESDSLECSRCGALYPFLSGVPCLMPDPKLWRARAAQRLEEYFAFSAGRLSDLEREQAVLGLLPRTRARIARIIRGLRVERDLIERVLAPIREGDSKFPAPGTFAAAPMAGIFEQFACYEHVFRDWAWGETESAEALGMVTDLMARAQVEQPARLGIFGAGAGRLAVDVHRTLKPAQTLALDLNPLPLLIADRLLRGETMSAFEFPVAPRGEDDVAVERQLRCPVCVPAGLTFLLADGLSPPFPARSLDVVITPWFIDIVDVDPRVTATAVSRVLKPGGLWLNFGPLRFKGSTSRVYTIEEVMDIVAGSGFEPCAQRRERVPYFASPESGAHRLELVYGFAARKTGEAWAAPAPATDPPWVVDIRAAIPMLPEWGALRQSTAILEGVIALIDGQRSIVDIADELGHRSGTDPRSLDAYLQAFLVRFLTR